MSVSSTLNTRISIAAAGACLALAGGLLTAGGASAATHAPAHDGPHDMMRVEQSTPTARPTADRTTAKQIALYRTMRTLWADHMQWTYATVDAFFHNPQSVGANLDRLLRNQADIGKAIAPYYGRAAARQLTALLTEHIELAVPVLTAAKASDQQGLTATLAAWKANAIEIADFLTKANPREWPARTTRAMMTGHIDQTTAYAVDLLAGDYAKAIADYDTAFAHMMAMADALSRGLIDRFPNRF